MPSVDGYSVRRMGWFDEPAEIAAGILPGRPFSLVGSASFTPIVKDGSIFRLVLNGNAEEIRTPVTSNQRFSLSCIDGFVQGVDTYLARNGLFLADYDTRKLAVSKFQPMYRFDEANSLGHIQLPAEAYPLRELVGSLHKFN
jgi:hypothetical protein